MLIENTKLNLLFWEYIYNGAGVATGDLDNDGKIDLYFCGNQVDNKLYWNKGDMKFEDGTHAAGVAAKDKWSNGVTLVDINSDGYLDIYVSCSDNSVDQIPRANLLYINNGDRTFTEKAREYGLADEGNGTQASFFDYDNDGDLDVFVANHPGQFDGPDDQRVSEAKNPRHEVSNHMYRNDDGKFTDVTKEAGLLSFDFTLGLLTMDFDGDNLTDIYLGNDYIEADRYYINNGDGTFSDKVKEKTKHTSNNSMGIDLADMNNDLLPDLIELDMVAKDNYRQKTMMSAMNADRFWWAVNNGYHYQYMRNTLQLNSGNGVFVEIGQMSGTAYSDWSWSVLFSDYDNDGFKDVMITNGNRRDGRHADMRKKAKKMYEESGGTPTHEQINNYIQSIPVKKIPNYLFKNDGNYRFEDVTEATGFGIPSFSNGAAYADLDNDGDLDFVSNNILDAAFVQENLSNKQIGNHYIQMKFKGPKGNSFGYGTKVTIKTADGQQFQELTSTRGYLSSMAPVLHFGLGKQSSISEITVRWPDGKTEVQKNVPADKMLTIDYNNATGRDDGSTSSENTYFASAPDVLKFTHVENEHDDYIDQVLLPHKMSQFGPMIATGDVNGDGLDDCFIGGAAGQSGGLFIQGANGTFTKKNGAFAGHAQQEDLGAEFFDADGDKDLDLYVASGGNEWKVGDDNYKDRLYLNDGSGNFSDASDWLPDLTNSSGCVKASDFDGDGDIDLFVGGRHMPRKYPYPAMSVLLENDGGTFKNVTNSAAPELESAGMVTDALWTDFDGDGTKDLIVVGEWMPVMMMRNNGGNFQNLSKSFGLDQATGWWFSIAEADLNGDGKNEYILGNLGLNYKYQTSATEPFQVYGGDYDNNSRSDIVLGYFNYGKCYPVRGRQCSSEQIPEIARTYPTYESFGKATLTEVYGDKLKKGVHYEARTFSSSVLWMHDDSVELRALPIEAQFAPVNGTIADDFNGDGKIDLLLAGNLFVSEVETGRADAGEGLLMLGDGKGGFDPQTNLQSGFRMDGDVKDLAMIKTSEGGRLIIVANNDAAVQVFRSRLPLAQ